MADNNLTPDDPEDIVVTLSLEDGDVDCSIISIFEAGDREYIALLPENSQEEVYLYRYSEDADGNPSLDNIESDEEYEIASDAFDELLDNEEFDELDDSEE